ncbi:MAG: hypothetical protein ACXAAQ_08670 [Candidatus Thorarchaeota archaeon]
MGGTEEDIQGYVMTSLISTGETSAKKLYDSGASKVLESLA